MADDVERAMEDMVPELEDLEKRGIFSKVEIKSVVKKRRSFEYTLKRRELFRVDFQRYIQYEMRLDLLRRKRKKRMGATKTSASDHAGPRRIHRLYNRGLRRFKTDTKLWAQYIHFCKSSGAQQYLGRVYASALQYNPLHVDLWVDAASWEYEGNQNMLNARALLQKSLRLNGKSQKLWCEYLRLELLYVKQIRDRHLVLGLADEDNVRQAFLEGTVAVVVVKSAMQEIPDDLDFRTAMARVVHEFQDMGTALDALYESIAADFGGHPESYSALAERFVLEAGECNDMTLQRGCAIYESGLKKTQVREVWEGYCRWLLLHLKSSSKDTNGTAESVLNLMARIEAADSMTAFLYCTWADILSKRGDDAETVRSVLERGSRIFPHSAEIWDRWFNSCVTAKGDKISITTTPEEAMAMLPTQEQKNPAIIQKLIHMAFLSDSNMAESLETVRPLVAGLKSSSEWLPEFFLTWVMTWTDRDTVRRIYTQLIEKPSASVQLIDQCVAFEKLQTPIVASNLARLHERAVQLHGHYSVDVWLAYIAESNDTGAISTAGKLYHRALKNLQDPTAVAHLTSSVAACK